MSEDDIEMMGPDGQTPTRVDRDRRAPRFSWTPAYEATFFRSLCESVQLGLRENSSFKAEAWERAAQALQESHGAYPTKNHLINKSDNARKRFRLWRGLREDPEFLYNPVTKAVTATEDAWRAHIDREPLSRALRGRPFDHEDYMEILYPDVVGSGGAPKRIMKPRRRTDGPISDDSEMPGTGVLNLQNESTSATTLLQQPSTGLESPGRQRPSLSQTPTASSADSVQRPSTAIPPRSVGTNQSSALTPPEETAVATTQSRKRPLPAATSQVAPADGSSPDERQTRHSTPMSPEKRRRTSSNNGISGNLAAAAASPAVPAAATALTPSAFPTTISGSGLGSSGANGLGVQLHTNTPILEELVDVLRTRAAPQWREDALDVFFRDFADEDLDLQVKISENVLSNENKAMVFLSYAEAAARGPKQSPEDAAAPQPPEIIPNESASISSLVNVDMPSVHTVHSDFLEQEVQTTTQAERIEREGAGRKEKSKREATSKKARQADSWLIRQFASLSDGSAGALAVANIVGVVGLSSYLGYKAWGLHERGRLSWENIGVGAGILAAVGAAEAVFGGYLCKGKKRGGS